MDYATAKKTVQAAKPRENYLTVTLAYDTRLILPYKDGVSLLAALSHAETLATRYNEPPRIAGLEMGKLETSPLSAAEYERIKIAQLLNVTLGDLQQLETPSKDPDPL
jgi:hypothetical protein